MKKQIAIGVLATTLFVGQAQANNSQGICDTDIECEKACQNFCRVMIGDPDADHTKCYDWCADFMNFDDDESDYQGMWEEWLED